MFSKLRLIFDSLLHYRRVNFSVALGVAAGTAVLTGALLVGDSVRLSLRALTLDRLGNVNQVLMTNRFFRAALAAEVEKTEGFSKQFEKALPAIFLEATVERQDPNQPEDRRRAGRVSLYGVNKAFWEVGTAVARQAPFKHPGQGQIVLGAPLADELGAKVGDEIILRVPEISQIPRESALGDKRGLVLTGRFTVSAILKAEGLGRFGLRPTQLLPQNAYLDLTVLQELLDLSESVQPAQRTNAILLTGKPGQSVDPDASGFAGIQPTLTDYGLRLEKRPAGYFNLTSRRMLIDRAVEQAVIDRKIHPGAFPQQDAQPVLTYLANTIAAGDKQVPYSTVSGIDFQREPPLGPFLDQQGMPIAALADDEIVLNDWTAEQLSAKPGDEVTLVYFDPETSHGDVVERRKTFTLKAVTPLAGAAADPALTPEFPGITDKLDIGGWDPPFPFESSRIRPQDEQYWDDHQATPKAFVSLAAGQQMWASRFGDVSSLRIRPSENVQTVEQVAAQIQQHLQPASLGFLFRPVKAQQLQASSGATPFEALFLGFSMFIIASAVMLVALLFGLNVDARARDVGILLAAGLKQRQVRWLLAGEGLLVSAVGGLLGVAIGIGYAWLMIAALKSPYFWQAAIGTPFLDLYVTPTALIIGYVSGVVVCELAILAATRRMQQVSVRQLLAGQTGDAGTLPPAAAKQRGGFVGTVLSACWKWTGILIGWLALPLAIVLIPVGAALTAEAQAGAFFGSGALFLAALLRFLWYRLQSGQPVQLVGSGASLTRLAVRNGARNPARSVLTIGLVAAATFLIVAISAFRIDPSQLEPNLHSGNGGFVYVAQTSEPVLEDLNEYDTPKGQLDLALTEQQVSTLRGDLFKSDWASVVTSFDQGRITPTLEKIFQRQEVPLSGSAQLKKTGQREWTITDGEQTYVAEHVNGLLRVGYPRTKVFSLRVRPGDDSSCLNLYQTTQPRVLGVPPELIERGGFQWASTIPLEGQEEENPWRLLERKDLEPRHPGEPSPVPVVLDMATARYSLKVGPNAAFENPYLEITGEAGNPIVLRVVGLLQNSILQGDVLMSEANFLEHFPHRSGYQFFLIDAPTARAGEVEGVFENALGEYGFDAQSANQRLANFLAVQNTYLTTFQSLGGLGLLLGTFGLATVQLRNVMERRGELALLRAAGFRRSRLARLVMSENVFLLVGGLVIGILAALVAIAPHLFGGKATIPWFTLAVTLAAVLVVGLAAGMRAVAGALRTPLLPALRGD